jgi:hypothetical protein
MSTRNRYSFTWEYGLGTTLFRPGITKNVYNIRIVEEVVPKLGTTLKALKVPLCGPTLRRYEWVPPGGKILGMK